MSTYRVLLVLAFVLSLTAGPALTQDETPGPPVTTQKTTWKNERYNLQMTINPGWQKVLAEPEPAGKWLNLVQFDEPRTKATILLSTQATTYRSAEEMINGLKRQFSQNAAFGILRDEARPPSSRRPGGVLFEYTFKGRRGPEHAVVEYWFHLGRRYRLFCSVAERGWRTVSSDFMDTLASMTFTHRVFQKDQLHNYVDEPGNFQIYFPDRWKIRIRSTGPRVVFQSPAPDVRVEVYSLDARDGLQKAVASVVEALQGDGAKVLKRAGPKNHPTLGMEHMLLEYTRTAGTTTYRYLEIDLVHRQRLYRLVLAAGSKAFTGGKEIFDRMVDSFGFIR